MSGNTLWQRCERCGGDLLPEGPIDTASFPIYQFDNALWITFHGGYGMFVDNLDATLCNNSEDQWLKDEHGEYLMAPDKDGGDTFVPNLRWEPQYNEDRMCPGRPDYETVICHDCAHEICEREPWLAKLLNPYGSHAHRSDYHTAHPEHKGWDYNR